MKKDKELLDSGQLAKSIHLKVNREYRQMMEQRFIYEHPSVPMRPYLGSGKHSGRVLDRIKLAGLAVFVVFGCILVRAGSVEEAAVVATAASIYTLMALDD